MNYKIEYCIFILCGILSITSCSKKQSQKQVVKPNILLITSDDHGIQLGCYGDEVARTPNLDKLAGEGVQFTNAYVTQASCSSSRSSIQTGLYPHQSGQIGLCHRGFSMRKGIPNLVATLKENGYRTGILGKLHVQPENEYPFDFKLTAVHPTRNVKWVADTAKVFLESSDEPFFLYVNYCDPHTKFYPQIEGIPEDVYDSTMVKPFAWQGIDNVEQLARVAGYYNCVARLDVGVGMLLKVLEDLKVDENTLVIYIGDHGAPFTRGKGSCYESGVQIPFIMKHKDWVKAGTVSDAMISTVDILPTIMDFAGIEFNSPIEGNSLFKTLKGEKEANREYLFSEFTHHTHFNYAPRRAVRNHRFKLIHNLNFGENALPFTGVDGDKAFCFSKDKKYNNTKVRDAFNRLENVPEFELYDLKNDPCEFTNLADDADYSEALNELKTALQNWRKKTKDPLLDEALVQAYRKKTIENIKNK